MDFDDLETREEEFGPDDEMLSRARADPAWQEFLQLRKENARQQDQAEEAYVGTDWEDFIMGRRREWERLRDEERRQSLLERKGQDLIRNKSTDLAGGAGPGLPPGARPADGAAPRVGRAGLGWRGAAGRGQRRRGAFSRAVAAELAAEAEEPSRTEEWEGDEGADHRAQPAEEAGEDPTGLSPEDPTFAFVRKMIDMNRAQTKVARQLEEVRERWQADVEDGVIVPYLSDVLERIEEDEKRDPAREETVPALEQMLEKLQQEEAEESEFEKVKEFLPDLGKERREWTLAVCAEQQDAPLAIPAIQVLQGMYPERDLAARDALESFEVAQSTHRSAEEGYLDMVTAKRAEAAAEEREWLAWKAKYDVKRRLKQEGLAHMLPPAPKNSKIGTLPPSNPDRARVQEGGGGSSSSSGPARGVCGPRYAPLARSVVADPRAQRPPPAVPSASAATACPPSAPPPPETEEDKAKREDLERQERARLSKERLERMKERRRRREAGEEC